MERHHDPDIYPESTSEARFHYAAWASLVRKLFPSVLLFPQAQNTNRYSSPARAQMSTRGEKGTNGDCRLCVESLDDPSRPVPENLLDGLQHLQTFSQKMSEVSAKEIELLKVQYDSWMHSNAKFMEEKAEFANKLALLTEEQKKVKEMGETESKKLAARETRIVTQEQELKRREKELIKRESSFEEYRKRFEQEVEKTREDREENKRKADLLKQRETEFKESEDDLFGREEEFRCRMERKLLELSERSEIMKQKEMKISAENRRLEDDQADLATRRIWVREHATKIIKFYEEIWPRVRIFRQAEMDWLKRETEFLSQWLEKKEDLFITDQVRTTTSHELTPMTVRSEGRGWFGNVFAWKGGSGSRKTEQSLEELEQEFGISESRVVTETTMVTTTTTNNSGKRKPSPSPSEPLDQVKRQKIITTTTTEANPAQAPSPAPTPALESGEASERTTRLRKRRMAAES